jgi:hypothetical protein
MSGRDPYVQREQERGREDEEDRRRSELERAERAAEHADPFPPRCATCGRRAVSAGYCDWCGAAVKP